MLTPWLEDADCRAFVERASEAAGLDLIAHGTTSDADTIRDTSIAQPLIVTASYLSVLSVLNQCEHKPDFVAGHSVGEISAAMIAGILAPLEAMRLVGVRGRAMAAAAALEETSMAAVLGGERDVVISHLSDLGLIAANENGAKQIVAAGKRSAIDSLIENPPAGSRVRALAVAGAFHTHFMASAQATVQETANTLTPQDPTINILSNRDGLLVGSGSEFLSSLVSQITHPVRWDLCMESMASFGITGLVEMFPGGTLTGIAKRALLGVELLGISSPADLSQTQEFMARHAGVVPSSTVNTAEGSA
jgi:[acyl-carrier-protein] S-malonyltransferase